LGVTPREAFKRLYDEQNQAAVLRAGKQHLQGHLGLRARRHSRRFWIVFRVGLVLVVWLAIVAVIYLLERTQASASAFEHRRQERIDALSD